MNIPTFDKYKKKATTQHLSGNDILYSNLFYLQQVVDSAKMLYTQINLHKKHFQMNVLRITVELGSEHDGVILCELQNSYIFFAQFQAQLTS